MSDYLVRGSLEELDPDVYELTQLEAERQYRKLILIPSESQAPLAVREAMASAFQNIYAEGYPDEDMHGMKEEEILDHPTRMTHYRCYSDPRYYKGVEYADQIEALARRRCSEAFAANGVDPEQVYVNVQALSGAPANNAVYHALVKPGDTVMGLNLLHGGHLSHGSSVNRSGEYYNIVHYNVDPVTERLDYDAIKELALEHKPRMIIAGYSSYPWIPDWKKFRVIAESVGAYLLADISHIGGLVAAGVVPSPIGYAHVITSTTHKTLHGPRGAIIMTTDKALAKKIDKAVFPGEQGGPHVHIFAALALTFKLAKTQEFRKLQSQTIKNAIALSEELKSRGFRIPFGGTDCHMLNVDCTGIKAPDGTSLSGDQAARILDTIGIVTNRNTIPGDKNSRDPSGIRLGTPWITQRGFDEDKTRQLANIIADVLLAADPHAVDTPHKGRVRRAKVPFNILEDARTRVSKLAKSAGIDFEAAKHGYPHFYSIEDKPESKGDRTTLQVSGARVRQFLDYLLSSDISNLKAGKTQATRLITPQGNIEGFVNCVSDTMFLLDIPANEFGIAATWLRDLSDGYTSLDMLGKPDHQPGRLPGPIIVKEVNQKVQAVKGSVEWMDKPWYLGISEGKGKSLPDFQWEEPSDPPLQRTPLYEVHKKSDAKIIPFAGWEMPVWYTSVLEEHLATRQAAGLFDVSHMGVYQVEGKDAASFLDTVCANDVGGLEPGESLYSHFLTPDADVIDDTLVYRRTLDKFLVVVNASNDDKDRTWLESVRDGKVKIDNKRPWARTYGYQAEIRNLRDRSAGDDMRVDIALQGPRSRDIILKLCVSAADRLKILALKRTQLCDAEVGEIDTIVSRTGYTGEKMAFELFVHPGKAVDLWEQILAAGEDFGVKPIGLGARDSLRTEAGLPLYGHEMGLGSGKNERDLGVAEGGFGSYVKTYKPWFIGRDAYLAREEKRSGVVVRFRFSEKGVRMAHNGDPVLDKRGKVIGWVTSCAVDGEGFLTGQAYIDLKSAEEGTALFIYQGATDKPGQSPSSLKTGDRTIIPTEAVVISRFPKL